MDPLFLPLCVWSCATYRIRIHNVAIANWCLMYMNTDIWAGWFTIPTISYVSVRHSIILVVVSISRFTPFFVYIYQTDSGESEVIYVICLGVECDITAWNSPWYPGTYWGLLADWLDICDATDWSAQVKHTDDKKTVRTPIYKICTHM